MLDEVHSQNAIGKYAKVRSLIYNEDHDDDHCTNDDDHVNDYTDGVMAMAILAVTMVESMMMMMIILMTIFNAKIVIFILLITSHILYII